MTADDFKGRLRFLKAFDAGLDCDDSAPEAYGAQNLGISEDRRENPTGMNIQRETAEGTEFRNCRIRSTPAVSRAWTKMQAMRHAGAWCSGGAVLRPGKTLPIDGGRLRWGPLDGRNASHCPLFCPARDKNAGNATLGSGWVGVRGQPVPACGQPDACGRSGGVRMQIAMRRLRA